MYVHEYSNKIISIFLSFWSIGYVLNFTKYQVL